jgi:hypothetical protein
MVLTSSSAPCLSGQKNRDLNEEELELTETNKTWYSVPVTPLDPLTETDDKIDIRNMQRVG